MLAQEELYRCEFCRQRLLAEVADKVCHGSVELVVAKLKGMAEDCA